MIKTLLVGIDWEKVFIFLKIQKKCSGPLGVLFLTRVPFPVETNFFKKRKYILPQFG
jgi:hypothetical protein